MTQPKFAPITLEDEVREGYHLEPPRPWVPHRPGEFVKRSGESGGGRGNPGPDQGYALGLAQRLVHRLVLTPGEHEADVITGALSLALRRAASFGRAPVTADLEVALSLFGYLGDAPPELVALRRERFDGVDHDDWRERLLAESVPLESLRLAPSAPGGRSWQSRLGLESPTQS